MVLEFDDFGASHVISDMCQAHDCRDVLDQLHYLNPKFKVTLFTIPGEMTQELLNWCDANRRWVELAVHGFYHSSNYECEKITYDEFDSLMVDFQQMIDTYFVHGFRAPGWQISDQALEWLYDHNWWVADQGYNDKRRPEGLAAYVNYDGVFKVDGKEVPAHHGHTWNCVGNGIYETFDYLQELVKSTSDFKFVSEVVEEL